MVEGAPIRLSLLSSLIAVGSACEGDAFPNRGSGDATVRLDPGVQSSSAAPSAADAAVSDEDGGDGSPRCHFDRQCSDGNACNGTERCLEGECVPGEPASQGAGCDLDDDPSTSDICLDGRCVPSLCGDGFVDTSRGEQCDDGNHDPGDGCDGCTYSCRSDGECGACERCDAEQRRCVPVADGVTCERDGQVGSCAAGVCLLKSCSEHADCDDGNPCNGVERCVSGQCRNGGRPHCDDGNPCTEDVCDPEEGGCVHHPIDRDRDGHSPAELGDCGTDCDDSDPRIHEGADEICDGRDNDCDGKVDEGPPVFWYVDCDGDGYAARNARSVEACDAPPAAATGCGTIHMSWTSRRPMLHPVTDCNDDHPDVHPGQQTYQSEPIPGAPPESDFDYDCDGVESRLLPQEQGACESLPGSESCMMEPGWAGRSPDCGQSGLMIKDCHTVVLPGGALDCATIPDARSRVQRCL